MKKLTPDEKRARELYQAFTQKFEQELVELLKATYSEAYKAGGEAMRQIVTTARYNCPKCLKKILNPTNEQ